MQKIIVSLILVLLIIGCSKKDKSGDNLSNEILNNNLEITLTNSNFQKSILEYNYQINPVKVGPYLLAANKADSLYHSFINFKGDDNFEKVNSKYQITKNELMAIIYWGYKDAPKINIYQFDDKVLNYHSLMKLDISYTFNFCLNILSSSIIQSNYRFTPSEITVSNMETDNSKYSFTLNSQLIQQTKKRIVTIESVRHNNQLINSLANISDNYSISNIIFDSLEKGQYEIKGKVDYFLGPHLKSDEEFTHEFEVK